MRAALKGEKVRLRPIAQDDLALRADWSADSELCVLMGGDPAEEPFISHEDELRRNAEWLRGRHRAGAMVYAIEAEGRYIGDIDLALLASERKAELTVFIGDRSVWGKGYGTESVSLLLEELFSSEPADGVEVDVAAGNERALCFWRKLGFIRYKTDERGTRYLRLERPGRFPATGARPPTRPGP